MSWNGVCLGEGVLSAFCLPVPWNAIRSMVTPGSSSFCSALLMKSSYRSLLGSKQHCYFLFIFFVPQGLIRYIGSDFILTKPKSYRFFVGHLDQESFHPGSWRRVYYPRQTQFGSPLGLTTPAWREVAALTQRPFRKKHICTILYADCAHSWIGRPYSWSLMLWSSSVNF